MEKTDFESWLSLSKPTVGFLQSVFKEDYEMLAAIISMQAEKDAQGLCNVLDEVIVFCQRRKKELETYGTEVGL